jgi:CheY-like chemotaxis protein
MSKHVLLIDDDKDDAEVFSDALSELNMGTIFNHFDNPLNALQTLTEKQTPPPDIIFLDINMPSISGWECLKKIKNLGFMTHIPIVMYSTSNLEQEGLTARDIGAAAFFTKPSNFDELKITLSNLLSEVWEKI